MAETSKYNCADSIRAWAEHCRSSSMQSFDEDASLTCEKYLLQTTASQMTINSDDISDVKLKRSITYWTWRLMYCTIWDTVLYGLLNSTDYMDTKCDLPYPTVRSVWNGGYICTVRKAEKWSTIQTNKYTLLALPLHWLYAYSSTRIYLIIQYSVSCSSVQYGFDFTNSTLLDNY